MEAKLLVTLDGNGGIEVETEGFTGKVCDKVADEIVVKMGATVTQEKKKPEYWDGGEDPVKVILGQ